MLVRFFRTIQSGQSANESSCMPFFNLGEVRCRVYFYACSLQAKIGSWLAVHLRSTNGTFNACILFENMCSPQKSQSWDEEDVYCFVETHFSGEVAVKFKGIVQGFLFTFRQCSFFL